MLDDLGFLGLPIAVGLVTIVLAAGISALLLYGLRTLALGDDD